MITGRVDTLRVDTKEVLNRARRQDWYIPQVVIRALEQECAEAMALRENFSAVGNALQEAGFMPLGDDCAASVVAMDNQIMRLEERIRLLEEASAELITILETFEEVEDVTQAAMKRLDGLLPENDSAPSGTGNADVD